jgi:hypothetical protein
MHKWGSKCAWCRNFHAHVCTHLHTESTHVLTNPCGAHNRLACRKQIVTQTCTHTCTHTSTCTPCVHMSTHKESICAHKPTRTGTCVCVHPCRSAGPSLSTTLTSKSHLEAACALNGPWDASWRTSPKCCSTVKEPSFCIADAGA